MVRVIASAFLAGSFAFLYASTLLPEPVDPADIGPAGFPRLAAILMALLATALLIHSILKPENEPTHTTSRGAIIVLLLTVAHVAALSAIGYLVSTFVWLAASIFALGGRISALIGATGFIMFVYVFFRYTFGTPLP